MRLIDADKLMERMYHDAFETDSDMQKWDSGCWIRYKMFENAMDSAPTVDVVERIEYEKMKDLAEQYKFEYECMFEAHKEVLNKVLPRRVEVVRCENCKHYDEQAWDRKGRGRCKSQNIFMFPNDYCSYGERREE